MSIDIKLILNDLKEGKDPRTQKSLDKLNEILEAHCNRAEKDFSITSIGRVSSDKGGPGYQSLRATHNQHYRRLIEAWATKAGTTTKKPLAEFSRSREVPTDYKLLERISDPALRALFGQIVAERNQLKKEVNLLKQHANIVIDRRPKQQIGWEEQHERSTIEVLPSFGGVLTQMEITALEYSISDECMDKKGWQYTKAGQVKDIEYNAEVFPHGFTNAVRKVLSEISNYAVNSNDK